MEPPAESRSCRFGAIGKAAAAGGMVNPALSGVWLAVLGVALSLAGCGYIPKIPPSEGHLAKDTAVAKVEGEPPPPVTRSALAVPPPKPAAKPATYSVVVTDVPVKDLLFALARDTKQNIDIHPALQGLVSINAIDETLPAILDRVAKQVNLRYRQEGSTLVVTPDTPYMKTYKVNYVNMVRDTDSRIGVSGQITGPGGAGATGGGGTTSGGAASAQNSSQTVVQTKSSNDFWKVVGENIRSILLSTRAQTLSAEDRAARAEAFRAAREERLAQAEAVARAGAGAPTLFKEAFSTATQPPIPGEVRDEIVLNPVAGTISVMATEKQHALIQQYLDNVTSASQRQVLIEATIAEVQLSDQYQAGVDWSKLAQTADVAGFTFTQSLLAGRLSTPPSFAVGYANSTRAGNITAAIALLEQFGNTRVLSSPKLMALNNQTALLKVVDNLVYFSVEAQAGTILSSGASTPTAFTTTAHTVPVGVIMNMTPQINDNGQVTLTVRPTISRILSYVNDPNPALGTGTTRIVNPVPQIQVREMESVLQVGSGQTVILGGLMQDNTQRNRDAVPGLGSIPNIGEAFSFRNENLQKSELVIFLRPTVVSNPSLDSDELKFLQRFLPQMDKTGAKP